MTYDHDAERDSSYQCFIRFYSQSYQDNAYESNIRNAIQQSKNRSKRKEAETMVKGYRAFDNVREQVLREFRQAAEKVPSCSLVPILDHINQSMSCTFETLREEFTCSITNEKYPKGEKMILTPDPENPFGPAAVSYPIRSDFKPMLQSYRILARFRYYTMKSVTECEGIFHEEKNKVQELYDVYLHARKVLLLIASQEWVL